MQNTRFGSQNKIAQDIQKTFLHKLFYAKNGFKKQLIFEKKHNFKYQKNGHNAKIIYSPCKMDSLG